VLIAPNEDNIGTAVDQFAGDPASTQASCAEDPDSFHTY
jgi:hypothetical protein